MRKRRSNKKNLSVNTIFSTKVLEVFSKSPYQYFNYKQVSSQLGINGKEDREDQCCSTPRQSEDSLRPRSLRGR